MTSKEAYEKFMGSRAEHDPIGLSIFDAGWKAALDEAAKACEADSVAHAITVSEALHNDSVARCIKAIGELK